MEATLGYEQLPLFRRLPSPRGAKRKRRRSRLVIFIERVIGWVQLDLQLPEPIDPFADDEFDFPVRRFIVAASAQPPRSKAAASIFQLAALIAGKHKGRKPAQAAFVPSAPIGLHAVAVERAGGVVRTVGAMYPAGRWTPEKEEAERARRAKQRPPKPTAAAKTRGRKVREFDGEVFDD